ncbi:MAG TPA: HAMP domain-containing sensor histidine kinase [Thermoanaerobaculia bacterium]|nr:HAMP domain-containing sensor histidine kinase [Thermoanaerobaculia bacterium]
MRFASLTKRHALWLGFLAVLAPLALLLILQYRWLVKLDETSALAQKVHLDNYLATVAKDVRWTYEQAERALDLPSSLFTEEGQIEHVAHYFHKKAPQGVRRLFAVGFVGEKANYLHFFDPAAGCWTEPVWGDEERDIYFAAAPWSARAKKHVEIETPSLVVEEADSRHRILLYPITDEAEHVVGLTGMVLDEGFFLSQVLPAAFTRALPKFSEDEYVVTVRDRRGELVFSNASGKTVRAVREEVKRPFSLVFTDWTMGLASRHATAAEVAHRNFAVNVGLSALLAGVLLGGVLLALRTASRAVKLSTMKSDFVSNVSHELRTPLASIRVFGELLRLGRVESLDRAREYGEYIETESRRLTQLINNILDFSSIESGRKSYHFERADLAEVVAETLKTFEVRLRQSGFVIRFERPAAPLPPVSLDAGAIAQSLSNLLDNAVKYSNGGKEIAVKVERQGGWVVVAVVDQGVGIPRDEQRKIFDRFHRVSTGLIHDVKGSGLGLGIVRHIVEAHQGRVTVESKPGEGSTFSVWLPIDAAAAAAAASSGTLPEGATQNA